MLKLIAMLLMFIDHAALVFLPSSTPLYTICRLIGRLAMPIFAYKIALGFIHTRNFNQYLKRITIMTFWAQIPFIWMLYGLNFTEVLSTSSISFFLSSWNIGLTFICSLLILKLLESLQNTSTQYPILNVISIIVLGLVATNSDYGIYGILIVVIFYFFIANQHSSAWCICLLALATLLNYITPILSGYFYPVILQLPCVFSVLLIKYIPDTQLPLSHRLWYSFYPAHMLILALLRILIS